ncbi:MAG: YkgJ family cysteine cluster protein [Planctomycetes bacterium]|nr:YkgJ family cysteine cluster protein [Planctomycetota bacterium]
MSSMASAVPWYAEGLAFVCQGCGECCRGPGGYVWVTENEVAGLAAALGMGSEHFAISLLRSTATGLALIDNPSGDCPLLGGNGHCRVYEKRPLQCRTWPWWKENLVSRRHWDAAAVRCPGINRGTVHSRTVIECEMAKVFCTAPGAIPECAGKKK